MISGEDKVANMPAMAKVPESSQWKKAADDTAEKQQVVGGRFRAGIALRAEQT